MLSHDKFKYMYQISIQYLKRMQRRVWKTKFQQRAITPVKVRKAWQNSNLNSIKSKPIHLPNFKSISQKTAEKSPENLIFTNGNHSCKSRSSVTKTQTWTVLSQKPIHFKSISQKTAEKSPENYIFTKGKNSSKSQSSMTKLELDLY